MKESELLKLILCVAMSWLLCGCVTKDILEPTPENTRFYALKGAERNASEGTREVSTTVVVGPIRMPKYLNRPEIVTTDSTHQVARSDGHRWGEPLEDGLGRVLISELSNRIRDSQVSGLKERPGVAWDYRVGATVDYLEGSVGGEVSLGVNWWIRESGSDRSWERYTSLHLNSGSGYEGYVRTLNELARLWGSEVAVSIEAIRKKSASGS